MSKVEHCGLAELAGRLGGRVDHLLMSVSYEERALGVWHALRGAVQRERVVFFNENHTDYLSANLSKVRSDDPGAKVVPLDSDEPLVTFDRLRESVRSLAVSGARTVAVDITGFTREALCVLVYLLEQELPQNSKVTCIYSKAQSYGASKSGGWLSQGVREVRSILGFSGLGRLTGPTRLILLPGYEVECALEIVESVQPSRLSLGFVTAANSVAPPLNEVLEGFAGRLEAFYAGGQIERFDFSSVDPFVTRDRVLAVSAEGSEGENTVVACLNTKPAMLGAALACVKNPALQLIYAQPVCYNTAGYSKPSDEVLFFDLPLGAGLAAPPRLGIQGRAA